MSREVLPDPYAPGQPGRSRYLLDNATREAPIRFAALSALFDSGTIGHLVKRGIGRGWHCLEVGGGGGSIVSWLAARVGPTGRVLATDIDTRFLESLSLPNVEVQKHNIHRFPAGGSLRSGARTSGPHASSGSREGSGTHDSRSEARRLADR
jgi:hypothetical protein